MAASKTLGYVLIAIGVLIILFVAFVGYTLYGELISGSLSISQYNLKGTPTGSSGNASNASALVNQVASNVVSQVLASLPLAMYGYVLLAILALFLVLSAAGRLVIYGIRLIAVRSDDENQRSTAKQK
jgi:hypothetical protein